MRKSCQLAVVAVMLLVSAGKLQAQATANANATVTIVTPLAISLNQSPGFERITMEVAGPAELVKTTVVPAGYIKVMAVQNRVIAADLIIDGNIGDIYSITIPKTVGLIHSSGIERMNANLLTDNISQQEILNYGKQHLKIEADLHPPKGQLSGKYSSTAFDVTVNFN
jgi:hypothetical protein